MFDKDRISDEFEEQEQTQNRQETKKDILRKVEPIKKLFGNLSEKFKKKDNEEESTEAELFEELSKEQKENYLARKKNILKMKIGAGILIAALAITYFGIDYLKGELSSTLEENIFLQESNEKILKDIAEKSKFKTLETSDPYYVVLEQLKKNKGYNIESLLQEVTLNGKIAKLIYDNRDEVLEVLHYIESLLPKDKDSEFVLTNIKRNGRDTYVISGLIQLKQGQTKNEAIRKTAWLISVFDKSNEILAAKRLFDYEKENGALQGSERQAMIVEFKKQVPSFKLDNFNGTSYSPSDNSFPLNFVITFNRGVGEENTLSSNKK